MVMLNLIPGNMKILLYRQEPQQSALLPGSFELAAGILDYKQT